MNTLDETLLARPLVFATGPDLERLRSIVRRGAGGGAGADLLAAEVARLSAPDGAGDRRFVRLGSRVTYKDLRTKRRWSVTVVAPEAAALDENQVSVASPIGAALIGLTEGAIFRWRNHEGAIRAVSVLLIEG